ILTNEQLNKTFDVALHMGTFVGAVVYFWRDIWRYLVSWVRSIRRRRVETVDERLAWCLVIGTIPGALAGALFEDVIERKLGQAQAVALQPGVSRSGVTITAARGLGLKRDRAARFSFLLSIPIIGGAGAYKGAKILLGKETIPHGFAGPFALGIIASAISGFLVIWGLLAYLRKRDFAPFVVYRLAAAAFVLGIIAAGIRPASV